MKTVIMSEPPVWGTIDAGVNVVEEEGKKTFVNQRARA